MTDIDPTANPASALAEANWILEQVTKDLGRTINDDLRLRFPRGFLRTAAAHRKLFPFIKRPLVHKNLGYSFKLADVYWWLRNRTDLAGLPHDMVVKAALVLQGAIAEALLVDALSEHVGRRQPVKKRTAKLVELGVITPVLQGELDWLWDMRNQQHLYELDVSEFDFYERSDLERATAAVGGLMSALQARSP